MSENIDSTVVTPSHLADAFSEHVQATIRLAKVALEVELTVFTRFTVGVIAATFLSIIYLVWTLRHSRRPLVVWEKLNKPLIKVFRPKIFAFLLGNINPYSGSIGKSVYKFSKESDFFNPFLLDMRISTFSRGFCTGFMRASIS
jgi:hypothetical protein